MHSRLNRLAAWTFIAQIIMSGSTFIWSQTATQNTHNNSPNSAQGKQTFASTCAQCHGLDAKGSERGPDIADRPSVQRLSDAQVGHIVENGVPGTGMPAFHSLKSSQIKDVVAYLRILQGKNKAAALPGNPEQGKTIFSGKAGCSGCHMVAGKGGFIATDLSEYARIHTLEQIRSAILSPENTARPVRLASVTLRSGEKLVGRVRDEDNFSVQLQTLDGAFHFLSKSDIAKLDFSSEPLMPSDYGSRLTSRELNDLMSYLMSIAGTDESTIPKKVNEWEE